MREVIVHQWTDWRRTARILLEAGIPPEEISWRVGSGPGVIDSEAPSGAAEYQVPRRFLELAAAVATHEDPGRWDLLYRLLFRITHGEPKLLNVREDEDVQTALRLERAMSGRQGHAIKPVSVQPQATLDELRTTIRECRGCELYQCATQAVWGEGPPDARVVFVGEQPGDEEDLAGRPFVGPAGRLLDRALAEAGIDRFRVYITNAVKHFKFVGRGKRRIHQTPQTTEISACRPWLEAEISLLKPEVIVCLGATAGRSVMGRPVRVLSERGRFVAHHWARHAMITVHPSAVLRAADPIAQERDYRLFVDDLRLVRKLISGISEKP